MLIVITTWLAVMGTPAAVPPPVEQERAQCAAPVYASDQLICKDPELLALDGRVARLARQVGGARIAAAGLESQAAWIRRRSLCAMQSDHRGCLKALYRQRARGLEGL